MEIRFLALLLLAAAIILFTLVFGAFAIQQSFHQMDNHGMAMIQFSEIITYNFAKSF